MALSFMVPDQFMFQCEEDMQQLLLMHEDTESEREASLHSHEPPGL